MKSTKKIVTCCASIAMIATLMMGAFSYFTDYQTKTLQASAGTLELALTDATADLTAGLTILNPGDANELTFTASNTGEKSMDVKAVITVTADKAMSESDHQYKVTKNGSALNGSLSADGKTLVYTVDDIVLSGSIEEDGDSKTHKYDYLFEMDADANNSWQDSNVEVKIELYAKQHRNTSALSADWTSIVEK